MPIIGSLAGVSARGLGALRAAAAAAGGYESFYSIASYTVPSNTGSVITFNTIDQTFKDLVIIISAGATYGGSGGGSAGKWYFNNDQSSAAYNYTVLSGNGSTVTSGSATIDYQYFGAHWAGNVNPWGMQIFHVFDYARNDKYKAVKRIEGGNLLLTNGTNSGVNEVNSMWKNNAPITRIDFQHPNGFSDGDLRAGSEINIFGIKG